jgi:hypothetical protein
LHLFLLICIIACFLRYIATPHWIYLSLLSFAIGLDYLDRVNGLFLAISAFAVLLGFALSQYFFRPKHRSDVSSEALAKEEASAKEDSSAIAGSHQNHMTNKLATAEASGVSDHREKSDAPGRRFASSPLRRYVVLWWHYLLAALVLIVTTAPSWLSRLYYFGNPFYYGAIQNFLWGDTYLGSTTVLQNRRSGSNP